MGNTTITELKEVKNLGVWIDQHLKFNKHARETYRIGAATAKTIAPYILMNSPISTNTKEQIIKP